MIDLHCHSHYSDGLLSPEQLIAKAMEANVRVLALTDHDTTAGSEHLQRAAEGSGVQVIHGIELSVRWKLHDLHILGLGIALDAPGLVSCVQQQEESRVMRAQQIGACLLTAGVVDAYDKACVIAGHERVGRPHFAEVLVNEGVVRDVKQAFKQFLVRGRPAYVPTTWLSLDDAIEVINAAGGQAVIAHPLKYKLTRSKLHALIRGFKEAGGVGMEVVSGLMTTAEMQEVAGLCGRFELLASTGSDFHGDAMSRVGLGRQRSLPESCIPIWHNWAIH
jgi:predicted metal-dependent phosphoesterase TrpH